MKSSFLFKKAPNIKKQITNKFQISIIKWPKQLWLLWFGSLRFICILVLVIC